MIHDIASASPVVCRYKNTAGSKSPSYSGRKSFSVWSPSRVQPLHTLSSGPPSIRLQIGSKYLIVGLSNSTQEFTLQQQQQYKRC